MLIYDYHCADCGTIEDVMAAFDDTVIACPKCGKPGAFRLFSPPRSKPIMDIEPYLDENISKNGVPVYVQSRQHKASLLKENGLIMKDSISSYR